MKFGTFMEQQRIEQRVALAAAHAGTNTWESELLHEESSTVPLNGVHFPNLPDGARERMAERGIDPENSFKAMMLDVKKGPLGGALARGLMAQIERERLDASRAA